jgi:hypothetical protein
MERRLLRDRDRLIENFKGTASDVLAGNLQNILTIANDILKLVEKRLG